MPKRLCIELAAANLLTFSCCVFGSGSIAATLHETKTKKMSLKAMLEM
jgi:hypothetical protein